MRKDGWERASIRFWTRPDRPPVFTTPSDFLSPSGSRTLGMFWRCGVIAFGGTLFYVLLPLVLILMWSALPSLGNWPWLVSGVAFAGGWLGTFWAAVREDAAVREWLEDQ